MLVFVWLVNLYGKLPSVSYCMDYDSVLCICTGCCLALVIASIVHLYGKITCVSYCMRCAYVR